MKSLLAHIKNFTAGRVSIQETAKKVDLSVPFSMLTLIARTEGLEMVIFKSDLVASTVKVNASLIISSAGFWNFEGTAHEEGISADNYIVSCNLLLNESEGRKLAVEHNGTVHGRGTFKPRDDTWHNWDHDGLISSSWEEMKNRKAEFRLNVNEDLGGIIETVIVGLFSKIGPFG